MSGRPPFRKKFGNCNKPLRRDREREEKDFSTNNPGRPSTSGANRPRDDRPRPPPGLRGKEIGLWYRDQQRKKPKEDREPERLEVTLDVEKREEIEALLAAVQCSLNDPKNGDNDTLFRQSFLNKITTTFEDRIDKVKNVVPEQNPALVAELYNKYLRKLENSRRFKDSLDFRQTLPSFKKKDEIVEVIEKNQIVVIYGETGIIKFLM